jgi:hypothetical protein
MNTKCPHPSAHTEFEPSDADEDERQKRGNAISRGRTARLGEQIVALAQAEGRFETGV